MFQVISLKPTILHLHKPLTLQTIFKKSIRCIDYQFNIYADNREPSKNNLLQGYSCEI